MKQDTSNYNRGQTHQAEAPAPKSEHGFTRWAFVVALSLALSLSATSGQAHSDHDHDHDHPPAPVSSWSETVRSALNLFYDTHPERCPFCFKDSFVGFFAFLDSDHSNKKVVQSFFVGSPQENQLLATEYHCSGDHCHLAGEGPWMFPYSPKTGSFDLHEFYAAMDYALGAVDRSFGLESIQAFSLWQYGKDMFASFALQDQTGQGMLRHYLCHYHGRHIDCHRRRSQGPGAIPETIPAQ